MHYLGGFLVSFGIGFIGIAVGRWSARRFYGRLVPGAVLDFVARLRWEPTEICPHCKGQGYRAEIADVGGMVVEDHASDCVTFD